MNIFLNKQVKRFLFANKKISTDEIKEGFIEEWSEDGNFFKMNNIWYSYLQFQLINDVVSILETKKIGKKKS